MESSWARRSLILSVDGDGEVKEAPDSGYNAWIGACHEHLFSLLFLISQWKLETLTKRVTVAINLRSGVRRGGFSVYFLPEICSLELTVSWLSQLVNIRAVHKNSLLDPALIY